MPHNSRLPHSVCMIHLSPTTAIHLVQCLNIEIYCKLKNELCLGKYRESTTRKHLKKDPKHTRYIVQNNFNFCTTFWLVKENNNYLHAAFSKQFFFFSILVSPLQENLCVCVWINLKRSIIGHKMSV